MVVYIGMFAYCFCMMFFIHGTKDRTKQMICEMSILLVLGFVAGFSDLLQISDMRIYQLAYRVTPTVGQFRFSTIHSIYGTFNMEKGFLFLFSVLKTFHISFRGFLFLHTVFFLGAFYYGVKRYTDDFAIAAMLFLYKIYFYNCFISMRQSITIAIFCIIVRYIEEKKIVPYLFGCLIAIQFHYAALILIPVYFIAYIKITKQRVIIWVYGCTAVSLVINLRSLFLRIALLLPDMAMKQKLISYFTYDTAPLQIFHTLEYLLLMTLMILFYDQIMRNNEHAEIIFKLMIALLPILTLFRFMSVVTRFKDYFTIFYGVAFSFFYKLGRRENRYLIYTFAVGLSLFGYVRYILSFGGGKSLLPYKNIIFQYLGIG